MGLHSTGGEAQLASRGRRRMIVTTKPWREIKAKSRQKVTPVQEQEDRAWVERELLEMSLREMREMVGKKDDRLQRIPNRISATLFDNRLAVDAERNPDFGQIEAVPIGP